MLQLNDSVAIVADTYEAAWFGAEMISIEWGRTAGMYFDSETEQLKQQSLARDLKLAGIAVQDEGDVTAVFDSASETIDREYQSDFQYAAYIEPLNAVVNFSEVSNSAEVWTATQAPTHTVRAVSKAIGIPEENVFLNRTFIGGAFGRKAAADQDWVADTARLSKQLGRPVKLMMTRNDDMTTGRFKPLSAHFLRAAISANGNLDALHQRVVSDEPLSVSDPVVVGVPAAIANSFAALSNGKRLYQLPFTEDRVKAVLGK